MAIKNSRYKIKNGSLFDVYHFETNTKSVKVLNGQKQEVGGLEDLLFKGKVVSTGSVSSINISGYYQVTNLTGMPPGVSNATTAFLKVSAFGEIGAPTTVLYELTDKAGNIYQAVKNGSTMSPWSSGGANMQAKVNEINSLVGAKASLPQSLGNNLVDAVRNLGSNLTKSQRDLDSFKRSYDSHNHDTRYLQTTGVSDLLGTIRIRSGAGIEMMDTSGRSRSAIRSLNSGTVLEVGNTDSAISLKGSGDLLFNGRRVVTIGSGSSGVNAEKLDGISSSDYIRRSVDSTVTGTLKLSSGVKASLIIPTETNNNIRLANGGNYVDVTKSSTETTALRVKGSTSTPATVSLVNSKGKYFTLQNTETEVFSIFNNSANKTSMSIKSQDNVVRFEKEIQIGERKLYLQPTAPTGTNHPVGSIWIGG
ncbi:TPA: hypothetical protein ACGO1T_000556 [Streptococcus suis]